MTTRYQEHLAALQKAKHQESILAVRMTGSLSARLGLKFGITHVDWDTALIAMQSETVERQRSLLEKDNQYLQYLPYVTFAQMRDGRLHVFLYQRGKGVGEARLAGDYSCGLGGHVEGEETKYVKGIIDLDTTLFTSMIRELEEETGYAKINQPIQPDSDRIFVAQQGRDGGKGANAVFNGLIVDSDEVGSVHIGLNLVMVINPDLTDEQIAEWLYCSEPELETVGMVDAEAAMAGYKLEGWTRIVIGDLLDQVSSWTTRVANFENEADEKVDNE